MQNLTIKNSDSYDLIFIIFGPAQPFHYKEILGFFNQQTHNVITVGNGTYDVLNEEFEGELISTLISLKNLNWFNSRKILFFIYAHGIEHQNEYYLSLGAPIRSSLFFSLLTKYFLNPFDLILLSCHSKLALQDVSYLIKGSNLVLTADEYSTIGKSNIYDLFLQLNKTSVFSLNNFYDNYVAHLASLQSPLILIQNMAIDPIKLLPIFLGKELSLKQKTYIQENFSRNVCLESQECYLKINKTIEKLENATSINIFYNNSTKYKLLYPQIQAWQKNINLYNSNNSCSIKSLDFKKEIDHYLFSNQFPLNLNLGYFNWHVTLPPKEILEEESEREIYNIYTQSVFDSNDNFSPPDYFEIGLLLGIIKDLSFALISNLI